MSARNSLQKDRKGHPADVDDIEESGFTTDGTLIADNDAEKKIPDEEKGEAGAAEAAKQDDSDEMELTGIQFHVLMAAIMMAAFLMAMNGTVLGTAIPAITDDFDSVNDVGWYASAYMLANCAMSPFVGRLYKLFRLKAMFITMVGIFILGSLLAAVSANSDMLIVARMITGLGGSGVLNGGQTIIAATVPISKRSMFNGIILGTFALGQAIGPLIGGALTVTTTWRWCFYFNMPLGGAVMLAFIFIVKLPIDTLCKEDLTFWQKIFKIDLIGFFIFSAASSLFLIGLQWGGTEYEWTEGEVIGLIVVGLVGFFVFAGWLIWKGEEALIPPRLLKNRINVMIVITSFVQSGATITSLYWLPIWFQAIRQSTAFESGVLILPLILGQLVCSVLCGYLVQKTGYYLPEVIAGNVLVAIGAGLTSTFTPTTSSAEQVVFQILMGAGRGFVLQLLVTAIQANVPRADASIASAYCMFSQYLGSAFFASIAKTIFTSSMPAAVAKYAPFIDADELLNMGVGTISTAYPPEQLPDVRLAYNGAIINVFYLQLGAAGTAFITGWGMGWINLKNVKQERLTNPTPKQPTPPEGEREQAPAK